LEPDIDSESHSESFHHRGEFTSVCQLADGSYAAIGQTPDTMPSAVWLVRTDPTGNSLWEKNCGRWARLAFYHYSVGETADGCIVAAGKNISCGFLLKVDLSGNEVFFRAFSKVDYPVNAE